MKLDDYYKKQDQIEKQKSIIRRQHEEELEKHHQMEMLKEEMFTNIKRSKEEMENTKVEQVLKKTQQVETRVFIYIILKQYRNE